MVNLLSLLWTDFCDVVEFQPILKENGATTYAERVVFSNIPCRLSYKNSPAYDGGGLSQKIKLFLPVDYDIKPGSKIIISRGWDIFEYKQSGKSAKYSAHQEVELELLQERA